MWDEDRRMSLRLQRLTPDEDAPLTWSAGGKKDLIQKPYFQRGTGQGLTGHDEELQKINEMMMRITRKREEELCCQLMEGQGENLFFRWEGVRGYASSSEQYVEGE